MEPLEGRRLFASAAHDTLYISDASDDTVKAFDAVTGTPLATTVASGAAGLHGPRGLIFRSPGKLLVVNQNVDQPFAGEVLSFNPITGHANKDSVPSSDPDAPFAPRGIVMADNVLYVADVEGAATPDGRVATYDANNGKFLGDLVPSSFPGQFNPRGVVIGPDGDLYVSSFDTTNPLAGYITRFDLDAGGSQIVAANDGDGLAEPGEIADLHRPDGLTFGPDGKLYVTSFRASAADTDKILIINAAAGVESSQIALDAVGQPRAFAQAIAFGPGGKLFAPISGNGPDTGSVRAYDVSTGTYTAFISPGGALGAPLHLTFGQTDPATLAYDTKSGAEIGRQFASAGTAGNSLHRDKDDAGARSVLRELLA